MANSGIVATSPWHGDVKGQKSEFSQNKCANQDLSRPVGRHYRTGVKLRLLLFIWDAAPITLPEKLRAYPIFQRVSQTSRRIAMKISPDNKLRKRVRKIENKLNLSRMKTTMFSREKNNEAIKQWTSQTFFIIRHYLNVIYLFIGCPPTLINCPQLTGMKS